MKIATDQQSSNNYPSINQWSRKTFTEVDELNRKNKSKNQENRTALQAQ